MKANDSTTAFFRLSHEIVNDLDRHNPWIYWTDFLLTMMIGYGSAAVYLFGPQFWPIKLVSLLIASSAFYRLALFIHEIAHFRKNEMQLFRATWNLLAGIPLMLPAHFYNNHVDHHNTQHYGTEKDGEYLPLGRGPLRNTAYFLTQVFFQPILVFLRFAILTPISFLNQRLQQWTRVHASSFVINLHYRNRATAGPDRARQIASEVACCIWAWTLMFLVFAVIGDGKILLQVYLLSVLGLGLNHLRTLAAHRYLGSGAAMTREQQLMDSTNVTGGGWLTGILFPVGLRYHALHHLFPRLPYHNLRQAHQRLMEELPADSVYRQTEYPTWGSVIKELVVNATRGEKKHSSNSDCAEA